jgi:hypothetical protein
MDVTIVVLNHATPETFLASRIPNLQLFKQAKATSTIMLDIRDQMAITNVIT